MWYTVYDLMSLVGPTGCTPFVDCRCWAVVHRERCSASSPYLVNATLSTLDGTGLCRDPAELPLWFDDDSADPGNLDLSITDMPATENLTSEVDINAELGRICGQTLLPGTVYNFASSTFRDKNSADGPVFAVANNISLCTTNYGTMLTQSTQMGQFTLPHRFYVAANSATQALFQRVSTLWEALKYGTRDRDVSQELLEYFLFAPDWRRPDPAYFRNLAAKDVGLQVCLEPPLHLCLCVFLTFFSSPPRRPVLLSHHHP